MHVIYIFIRFFFFLNLSTKKARCLSFNKYIEENCPFQNLMSPDRYQDHDVMKLLHDVERLVASSSFQAQTDFYHHQLNSLGHSKAHGIPGRSFH